METPNPQPQVQQSPVEDTDLSKRTLVILVILSCTISIIGVVSMLYQVSNSHLAPTIVENGGTSAAHVQFTIGQPEQPPKPSSTTGLVTLTINDRKNTE